MTVEPVLVVDLGSTAVSAALVVNGQVRLMKEPGGNALRWPSSLCRRRRVVGRHRSRTTQACGPGRLRRRRPARAIAPLPLVAGDRSLTGPDVVAVVLTVLRTEAERLHGTAPTRLTLTGPVGWPPGHLGRDALISAGEAVGFLDVDLLAEPIAAALNPESAGSPEPAAGTFVLVCDVGADGAVTLVQFTGLSNADIVAHHIVPGGAELDRLVLDRIRAGGQPWVEERLTADGDAGLCGCFEVDGLVRRLRHQLSDSEQAEDRLIGAPPYPLSRATLEDLARPMLDDLVGGCAAALPAAQTSTEQLSYVALTGGLCRMPALPGRRPPCPALMHSVSGTHAQCVRPHGLRGGRYPPRQPDILGHREIQSILAILQVTDITEVRDGQDSDRFG